LESARATLESGSRFEDRYEILGELGSGSFGHVYRARQLSTGQSVALKLLSPREGTDSSTGREAERFRRETRICAELSHTHIVGLIDSGETPEGQLYAVFAHVPGETLEQTLEREGRLSVHEALRLMTQVLDALAAAHAQGIVHRDLKPANVMLSGTGARRNALVLDFGLGGIAEGRRRKEWQTVTQSREFLGTPLYAAPEQLTGETPTERSDLYAWGLVFLECLTGHHPFEAEGAAARLLTGGGAVEIPEWLRGHRLGQLLETVTAREAAKRDVSVESLIEALDEIGRGDLPVRPDPDPTPAPLTSQGERRHLTVMFCDLVGSSALGQQLETEVYSRVVQAYHARTAEAIERYEGHVAQHLGDGLLVYFGYPQAHEDDAERAVRAGREILRELATLNPRLEAEHGIELQARVGIHTGPVVVGEVGGEARRETLALGDTINVAARLEGFAEPDTVVISDATLRLVAGLFVTEDRGSPALKGISAPIRVHRIVQPSGGTPIDPSTLTPFVGREQELGLLLDRFDQVQEGEGQAVWIAGEAGIGKSRLVHRLRERLRETPHTWLECRSSPYTQNSALYPVIELVERALGFDEETSAEEKLGRLERGLALVGLEPAETVPLFASLLSLRLPERYAPLEISPQLQRQRTLETLLAWVLASGEKQPLVLLVEDLHWIDPTTLEWLGLLIEQCPTAGVLLLLTFRPEFEPPWPTHGHLHPIVLGRLKRREARSLVVGTEAGASLPEALIDRIATRSDGIPLFVEELAKGVVASGGDLDSSHADVEIPETLQDSLMARLDRLGEAKELAQVGSAIGREFPYALLEAVAPVSQTDLREGLGRLVEAELLFRRGLPPRATYTFKHALVQDTAYQSLLESQRRELHGRIADALETRFPERVAREPDVVARHCEEAARMEQAIGYYRRAGERATQRSAQAEAIAHLRRAVDLVQTLPESPERNQQELGVRIALGAPLQAAQGMYSPEVEETYARGLWLSRALGATPERFQALSGLATFYRNREVSRALELGEELLACAEQSGEPSQLLFAHSTLAVTLHYAGEFTKARGHEERAIALYDPVAHRSLESVYGLDPGIASLCLASFTSLQLGHPDRAVERVEQAIAQAREHNHLYSLAYALNWSAIVHYARGEPRGVLERTEEAIGISMERGLRQQLGGAGIFRAWALSALAEDSEAGRIIDAMQPGQAVKLLQPVSAPFVGALADAQRRLHRLDDALRTVDAWLAYSAEIQAPYWDPESLRQRGEIRLAQDPAAREEAEGLFVRAVEGAKRLAGRFLELRAATSLARLLRDQDRRGEARAVLQPIYDWFTEGFDTADLKDARALLEQLSPDATSRADTTRTSA
jgi:TOMM system kinase/cyclase fusion protein